MRENFWHRLRGVPFTAYVHDDPEIVRPSEEGRPPSRAGSGRSFSRADPLSDFLGALRAIRDLPVGRVLPAHGEPFDDLPGHVDELLAHHAARLDAVVAALGDRERDAYAVCRELFPVLRSPHEERFALAETLAHLRHLERRGIVASTDGQPVCWRREERVPDDQVGR